jgi:hypothetical protein
MIKIGIGDDEIRVPLKLISFEETMPKYQTVFKLFFIL